MNIKKNIKARGYIGSFLHYTNLIKEKAQYKLNPLFERLFLHFPIKSTIVLECESDLDDNPRAIYEYLLRVKWNDKHKIVWIVKDVATCKNLYSAKNVDFVSRFDNEWKNIRKLKYYLNTSRWFVFSHPYWFHKKRRKQFVLNTWHGVGMKGIQKGGTDICSSFDMVLATSTFTQKLQSQIWPKEKFVVMEYPRTDFLKEENKYDIMRSIFADFKIGSKVIMCMPTFRQASGWTDSGIVDKYSLGVINTDEQLCEINECLKQHGMYMIIKVHPLQDLSRLRINELTNIRYVKNRELFEKKIVLYSLLGCCDALLTDVSSVYTDFLLLDRPVGFFMENFENYERGYKVENPLDYMPGVKIYSLENLKTFIDDLKEGRDDYAQERKRVCELFHNGFNTNNSEIVVNWLLQH